MISPKDSASIRVRFAAEPHGTRHRYLSGCKCVPCRAANSRYSTERAAAQRAGDWRGFVPATLVVGPPLSLRQQLTLAAILPHPAIFVITLPGGIFSLQIGRAHV